MVTPGSLKLDYAFKETSKSKESTTHIRVGDYVSEVVFSTQELFIFLRRSIYVTTCKVFDWSGKFLLRCYVSFTHGNMNNCKFFT